MCAIARSAILRRVRRRAPLALSIACLVAGGCGATEVHRISAWNSGPPYIPPPEPIHRTPPKRTGAAPGPGAVKPRGAPTDAEVQRELDQAYGTRAGRAVDAATVSTGGLATIPPAAPSRVAAIISAANSVARKPYVYGGGHGRLAGETFVDSAYDCSGSVSFALAAAGLVDSPADSSTLARFGSPGRGRWVTIYANAGHAFMTVAGLRFDTSGRGPGGSRWQARSRTAAGFTVRHPPGL
jgi:hypothetical protein